MNRANKALVVLVVSTLGLWGCARGPAPDAGAERIRSLELKVVKVEEDFRKAAATRDQLQTRLETVQRERAAVEKQLEESRQQLAARTGERDTLQTQYEQFRKNIRNLLGQAEAAAPSAAQPVTAATLPALPGKS